MNQGLADRQYWVDMLCKIGDPVLKNIQKRTLRMNMPVEAQCGRHRSYYAHLEAVGRLLMGIAPWLECSGLEREEERLRQHYAELAREAIDAGTAPDSPDVFNFRPDKEYDQPLVDAAFLANAIVRAPVELNHKLSARVRGNLVDRFMETRAMVPAENNHLLFAAMVEAGLYALGADVNWSRVEYALARHEEWYLGDGTYGDGVEYRWNYYNSFVIQSMLVDLYRVFLDSGFASAYLNAERYGKIYSRARRFSWVLEMMISPEGTFPAYGRSISYRMGAMQTLAQFALFENLPDETTPEAVRSALTAVIRRCMEPENTFDENGWLTIGLAGHQPGLGDSYICTGSLYLCAFVFLPLGLPPQSRFWDSGAGEWHGKRIWSGQDVMVDGAYKEDPNAPC